MWWRDQEGPVAGGLLPGLLHDLTQCMISVFNEGMKRITIDLEEKDYEQLRKAAFEQHTAMAAIVRAAMAAALASQPEASQPEASQPEASQS